MGLYFCLPIRLMLATGQRVEAEHYDRGDNAAIKVAAMAKWEAAVGRLLG